MGSGSIYRMVELGIAYQDIQYLFISHLHPDHMSDLAAFVQARLMKVVQEKGSGKDLLKLYILVGEGIYEQVRLLLDLLINELAFTFELVCIKEGERTYADSIELTIMRVFHSGTIAYASRWLSKDGRICTYTGDSAFMPELVSFSKNSDILLCDSSRGVSYDSDHRHMSAFEAGRLARESSSRHLVLIHNYPAAPDNELIKAARSEFDGLITVGK